ncbi:MAG: hypothetical protein KDH96_10075 [Candidatus Riesia sp.]|nr:hypothetical protein [Candidatus Riesia sp.]
MVESLTHWTAKEFDEKVKNSVIIHPKIFPNYPLEVFDFREIQELSDSEMINEFCNWAEDELIFLETEYPKLSPNSIKKKYNFGERNKHHPFC